MHNSLLPEQFTCLLIEAQKAAVLGIEERCGQKKVGIPNNWGGMTFARDGNFPQDVTGSTPMCGRIQLEARAVASRTPPHRPILAYRETTTTYQQATKQHESEYHASVS